MFLITGTERLLCLNDHMDECNQTPRRITVSESLEKGVALLWTRLLEFPRVYYTFSVVIPSSCNKPGSLNVVVVIATTTTTLHSFNGPLSRTTRVGRYQKGKTNLDFTEA